MTIQQFPPHEMADEHGLLAVGGDVEVESLLLAYRNGIFPWPLQADMLTWFSPPMRAVLELEQYEPSRSLKRFLKKHNYTISINRDFLSVIECCKKSDRRKDQLGTWITDELVAGYSALHQAGFAHSIEAYEGDVLVGGLYGVGIGNMFAGESMFYERDSASKLCLAFTIEWLRSRGATWMDCQVMTPLTESCGACDLPRNEFLAILEEAITEKAELFPTETVNAGIWRGEKL